MNQTKPVHGIPSAAGEEDPGAAMDGEDSAVRPPADLVQPAEPERAQAYENSAPGTSGNVPGEYKSNDDVGVSATMEQTAQTDSERGSPGMTPEDIRAMKR
jgi:hypothetical protein